METVVTHGQRWIHNVDGDIYTFTFTGRTLTLVGGPTWSVNGVDSEIEFASRNGVACVSREEMVKAMRQLWTKTYESAEALEPVLSNIKVY